MMLCICCETDHLIIFSGENGVNGATGSTGSTGAPGAAALRGQSGAVGFNAAPGTTPPCGKWIARDNWSHWCYWITRITGV